MWSVSINRHRADSPFHFSDLLRLQDEWLERLRPSEGSAILFAELAPTVTLGARQIYEEETRSRFQALGDVEVVPGERGGNETWHGPGQWVGFVLTPLQVFTGDSKGVRKSVYQILSSVERVVKLYVKDVHLEEGNRLGLWSDRGKLVSVGIKIRSGYVTSGFSVNCIQKAESFLGINPCGIAESIPDFLFNHGVSPALWESEFLKIPDLILESFSKE